MAIRRAVLVAAALFALLASAGLSVGAAGAAQASPGSTTPAYELTPAGFFRGARQAGVESFLGIRYAQPPVGALRWKPPQPIGFLPGITAVTRYGPRCAQPQDTNGPATDNEDCLFINVQRPSHTWSLSGRPVLVWIHGGSMLTGGADQHDGTLIVQSTGAIVVTMNYRLGALGFLAQPGLTAESGESGNYGFLDQQAALRWVQRNIRAFGGDPAKVTVAGESASAMAVCGHLTSPTSRGLFSAAILQSPVCPSRTQAAAEATGNAAASAAGCPGTVGVPACLRAKPVKDLVKAFGTTPPTLVRGTPTLPEGPARAVLAGSFARVPVLIGSNLDEGRTFTTNFLNWTPAQYTGVVKLLYPGALGDQVLARYPWPAGATDRFTGAYAIASLLTDSGALVGVGACPTSRLSSALAKYVPVYRYEFAHRTGPGLRPTPAGYVWGAGHAAELPYLWPSFDNGTPIAATFGAGEKELSRQLVAAWGSFVSSRVPQATKLPSWPAYGSAGGMLSLRADDASTLTSGAAFDTAHQCGFWNPLNTDGS